MHAYASISCNVVDSLTTCPDCRARVEHVDADA